MIIFKQSIIVLFFIFNYYNLVFSQTCLEIKCIKAGEICDNGQLCPAGYFCNTYFDVPTCISLSPKGESCERDEQCERGLRCIVDLGDRYCDDKEFKGYGEKCILGIECSNGLDCVNGQCYRDPDNCIKNSCPANHYCSKDLNCTVLRLGGETCDNDYECEFGSKCAVSPGSANTTCVPRNSKLAGEPCVNGDDTCNISLNLTCQSGFCKRYKFESGSGSCISNNTCSREAEECLCSKGSTDEGKCKQIYQIGAECGKAKQKYYECMKDSSCPLNVDNPDSANSCQSKKCGKYKCSYEQLCFIQDYQCNHQKLSFCPEITSSSNILISSNLLILLLLIIFIHF